MRILLADPNPDVRAALRLALEQQSGYCIAGEAQDALNLLAQVTRGCQDVLLLDPDLPGIRSGRRSAVSALIELGDTLRRLCPGLRIVALGSRPELRGPCEAAQFEAFSCKTDPPDYLLDLLAGFQSNGMVKGNE
jgi:DNA-binding NarL/FixJ family response regulator